MVLALVTDELGLPLTYEVFPGNTAETKTLICSLNKMKSRFNIKKIRLTADKAMYSDENLSYFEDRKDYEYIVACPLKKLPKKIKERVLDKTNYRVVDKDKSFFRFSYVERHFCVGYSRKREEHDRYKREKLLEKIRKMANKKGEVAVEKISGQKGISRYLEKVKGLVKINEERIKEDEKWDGIFGVCTNIKGLKGQELFSSYKRLWKIEESFRINKHTLRMRPIYHQLSRRIRSHILICFLSYALLRWTEIKLREKGLIYSVQELMDILSEIESWQVQDESTGQRYVIPKELSKEGCLIYKTLGLKRDFIPYRILCF